MRATMARKGQKSVQFGFKVTEALAEKMERERAIDDTTIAGFINDAIKFYINQRENKRLEMWRMEKDLAGEQVAQADPASKKEASAKSAGRT